MLQSSQQRSTTFTSTMNYSVEALELISLYRRLIFMKVRQRVLCAIVMSIIVCINSLRLETSNGIKFLYGCGTQTRQGPENCTFDLCDLGVLHGIDKGVLRLCSMVLEFLRCIFLTKGRDLIEVHLEIVGHLLCKLIFGGLCSDPSKQSKSAGEGELHFSADQTLLSLSVDG